MITVREVEPEVLKVLGTCSQEQLYSYLNEAIEELANISNWDPMVVYLDICTQDCQITLPDEIEVPIAINVGGHPAAFHNKWFEFHLNGPGSQCCDQACNYAWTDKGDFPTFRDPVKASQIAAYPEGTEEAGLNIRVYGYDDCGKWIMEADCNGVLQDGFNVPILSGFGAGMTSTQKIKRITRVSKPLTNSFIRLYALDPGSCKGSTLLGYFRPYILEPSFRRITVSGAGCGQLCGGGVSTTLSCNTTTWVRMRARRKTYKVTQPSDAIPLHSVTAIKMMCQAIRKYENDLLDQYEAYRQAAKQALEREQKSRSGPNQIRMQFQTSYGGRLRDNLI